MRYNYAGAPKREGEQMQETVPGAREIRRKMDQKEEGLL